MGTRAGAGAGRSALNRRKAPASLILRKQDGGEGEPGAGGKLSVPSGWPPFSGRRLGCNCRGLEGNGEDGKVSHVTDKEER